MGRSAPVWEFSRRCRNGWPPGCRLRFGQAESVWRQSCLRRELILAKAADLGLRLDDFGATRALDMVSALQFPFFQNWIVFGYIQYMDYRDKRYEHAIGDPPYGQLSFPPSHVYGGQTQRRHPQIYQKKRGQFPDLSCSARRTFLILACPILAPRMPTQTAIPRHRRAGQRAK